MHKRGWFSAHKKWDCYGQSSPRIDVLDMRVFFIFYKGVPLNSYGGARGLESIFWAQRAFMVEPTTPSIYTICSPLSWYIYSSWSVFIYGWYASRITVHLGMECSTQYPALSWALGRVRTNLCALYGQRSLSVINKKISAFDMWMIYAIGEGTSYAWW